MAEVPCESCGDAMKYYLDEIDEAILQERNRVLDILIDGLPDGMYGNGWVHSIIQKIEGEKNDESEQ